MLRVRDRRKSARRQIHLRFKKNLNTELQERTATVKRYVYFFGAGKAEGDGEMKDVLGGKGAGLAEMTRIGLPVPAGFTITTECCDYYLKHDQKYPTELRGRGTGKPEAPGEGHRQEAGRRQGSPAWSACAPARRGPCRE